MLKFVFSKKATKIDKIFTVDLTHNVKLTVKILSNGLLRKHKYFLFYYRSLRRVYLYLFGEELESTKIEEYIMLGSEGKKAEVEQFPCPYCQEVSKKNPIFNEFIILSLLVRIYLVWPNTRNFIQYRRISI